MELSYNWSYDTKTLQACSEGCPKSFRHLRDFKFSRALYLGLDPGSIWIPHALPAVGQTSTQIPNSTELKWFQEILRNLKSFFTSHRTSGHCGHYVLKPHLAHFVAQWVSIFSFLSLHSYILNILILNYICTTISNMVIKCVWGGKWRILNRFLLFAFCLEKNLNITPTILTHIHGFFLFSKITNLLFL